MKNHKSYLTTLLLLIGFNIIYAQQNFELGNSVLWKIEHPELEKPSFLYGTLHMMCEEDFNIPDKVLKVLEASDELILEINLQDPNEMLAIQKSMSTSKKISEELSPSQFQKLDSLFKGITGTDLLKVDQFGLSNLNIYLYSKMLPCASIKSTEMELMQIANAQQIPIIGLERAAYQMEIIKKAYPTEFAYNQLLLFESYKKDFLSAIDKYSAEDIDATFQLIGKNEYMDENAINWMLITRNNKWIEKMPEMMQDKSVVFAVGAAHLVNDYGVINLLRQKGYKVTAVLN